MLILASTVFAYYTVWTLLMVSQAKPSPHSILTVLHLFSLQTSNTNDNNPTDHNQPNSPS